MKDEMLKDFFQSGFYEDFWGWEFDKEESQYFAEKSIELLGISSGHVLDWCGGWGRISFYLAKKGFKITILDFIKDYLVKAKNTFKENNLELSTVNADCRKTPSDIQADHAICTFSSIGFLSDDDQEKAFKSLYKAIKAGGKVIVDSINQLFIAKHFLPVIEKTRPDGIKCMKKNVFDLSNSVLNSEFQLINKKEEIIIEKSITQRLYTPLELKNLITKSGFNVLRMFGDFEGHDLSCNLPQIILIAEK